MDHSRGYPVGDGAFASSARGTAPQKELDLQLVMMANDAYESEKTGATGTQSERELKKAGWQRLRPAGDHFLDENNKVVSIPDLAPKMLRNGKSGFDAAIYRNDQGQYVVAFRGTDQWFGPEGADIKANGGQALGLTTEQYKQAITLAQSAVRAFGKGNVIFTGHSLGGGLASAAMLATGAPGVTFNAAGLSDNTLRSLNPGKTPNAIREELAGSGQIRRYNVEGELLTGLQQGAMLAPDAVGHELRLAAPRGACCNPVELHGGKGDGQAYVEALRENTPYRAADKPLSLSALEHYMEANFNFLASAGSNAFEAGSNAGRVFAEKGQALDHIARNEMAQGRVLPGSLRAVGEAADGILDAGAGLVRQGGNFAGDAMREGASLLGHALRGAGKATGQEASFNQAALRVETAGERANALIDGASHEAAVLADKAGDDAKRAASEAADDVKRTSDKLTQGVRWLGEKTIQGAVWMIEKRFRVQSWRLKKPFRAQCGRLKRRFRVRSGWPGRRRKAFSGWRQRPGPLATPSARAHKRRATPLPKRAGRLRACSTDKLRFRPGEKDIRLRALSIAFRAAVSLFFPFIFHTTHDAQTQAAFIRAGRAGRLGLRSARHGHEQRKIRNAQRRGAVPGGGQGRFGAGAPAAGRRREPQ